VTDGEHDIEKRKNEWPMLEKKESARKPKIGGGGSENWLPRGKGNQAQWPCGGQDIPTIP